MAPKLSGLTCAAQPARMIRASGFPRRPRRMGACGVWNVEDFFFIKTHLKILSPSMFKVNLTAKSRVKCVADVWDSIDGQRIQRKKFQTAAFLRFRVHAFSIPVFGQK